MTVNEVKELLKIYYDIPQMIAEEFATIRNCEAEKNKISLSSVNLSGLPGSKGVAGDRTASMALSDQRRYYEEEIKRCSCRIADLRQKREFIRTAMSRLDRTDRQIIKLAYVGPTNFSRRFWRAPTWKEIAVEVKYSESQARARASTALLLLSDLSKQAVY